MQTDIINTRSRRGERRELSVYLYATFAVGQCPQPVGRFAKTLVFEICGFAQKNLIWGHVELACRLCLIRFHCLGDRSRSGTVGGVESDAVGARRIEDGIGIGEVDVFLTFYAPTVGAVAAFGAVDKREGL